MSDSKDATAQDGGAPGEPAAPGKSPASAEGASATAPSTGQVPIGVPATGTGEGSTASDPQEILKRIEASEKAATEARNEAARYRRQLREKERQEEEAKSEGLSEKDRLARDRGQLEAEKEAFERERLEFNLMQSMVKIGPKLNLIDPVDTLWLLDWDKIEWDDDGMPTNLEALTRDLIGEKTYLVGPDKGPPAPPTAPSIGATAGSAPGPAPALTAEELAMATSTGMDPARYARMKTVKTLDDYKRVTPGPQASSGQTS